MSERIVIVGAGQAGCQAAATLRAEGYSGALTLIGEEPFAPYQRPPLSKKYLSGEWGAERLELRPAAFYAEQKVELRLRTTVTAIEREETRVRLADGSALDYDALLMATGTRVRPVRCPGADLTGVLYLRTIEDVDLIRPHVAPGQRIVLVGGGYIGLEVAAVAVKKGVQVTVVEMAPRVMSRSVAPVVSTFYEAEHRKAGVDLRLGATVVGFEGKAGRLASVILSDGTAIPADVAVVGIGALPNQELAQAAGLACDDGILVDEHGRTADPRIFAAGDCTRHPSRFAGRLIRLESVQNAIDQAKHAALAMVGKPKTYDEVPWFWSDQYDLKLQIAGLPDGADRTVLRGSPAGRSFAVFYFKGRRLVAVDAVNAVPEYMTGRKLISQRAEPDPDRLANAALAMKDVIAA